MSDTPPSANLTPTVAWALLSPFGRLARLPYWLGFVLTWIVIGITVNNWVNGFTDQITLEDLTIENFMSSNALLPFLFFFLQWVELALMIKRCQDLGMSGFVALVAFIPVINLIAIVVLGAMPSQREPNRYGPLPNSYYRRR